MRRRVERLKRRADPSSAGHAHGVLTGEIDREFGAFVEGLVDEVVAESARIREQRERGEPEGGRDAPPLDGKPRRALLALAVTAVLSWLLMFAVDSVLWRLQRYR